MITSKERVLKAFNHLESDRIPIDLGGRVSGIHIKAYKRLLDYLRIEDNNIQYYDFGQQLAVPCDKVLSRLHIDTRYVNPPAEILPENHRGMKVKEYVGFYDQFGVFWGNFKKKNHEEINYYTPVIYPFEDFETVSEVENFEWPDPKKDLDITGLREKAKRLRSGTDCALVSPTLGNTFEYTTFLFGLSKAMKLVRKKPELIIKAMELLLEYWTGYMEIYLKAVGSNIDIVCVNGDLADQYGPLINPKFYVKHVKPLDNIFVQRIREINPAVIINYHSCGSVVEFLPHFIEIGYDSANPTQISALGMEPENLKSKFGSHISFWGGMCNSQNTLPFGTPQEVAQETRRNIEIFKQGGGFIASNVHNITAEVTPENIVAMFDAAFKYGTQNVIKK